MNKLMHLKIAMTSIFIVILLVSYSVICHFYSINLSHYFNERLRVSVEKSFVEEIFNDENSQHGNNSSIQSILDGYNKILSELITPNIWAPAFLSNVAIISVDDIKPLSEPKLEANSTLSQFSNIDSFELQRAGIWDGLYLLDCCFLLYIDISLSPCLGFKIQSITNY